MRKLVLVLAMALVSMSIDAQPLKVVPLVSDTAGNVALAGAYYKSNIKFMYIDTLVYLQYIEASMLPGASAILNQRAVQFSVSRSKAQEFFKALDSLYEFYAVPLMVDTIAVRKTNWGDLILVTQQKTE